MKDNELLFDRKCHVLYSKPCKKEIRAKITLHYDDKVQVIENKPFVSMPSYQTQTGDYAQYALPITKDFHEKLSNAVLRSYQSLGKTEYKGVKYAELGDKDSIAHLPRQNNKFADSLMTELDKAGIKYQAKVEGTTTISVNKADMPKVTDIKNQLVKTLNPEKQANSAPKHKR